MLLQMCVILSKEKGISVWCHFLCGCPVPWSFRESLCLVQYFFQLGSLRGVLVQETYVHSGLCPMGYLSEAGNFCLRVFVWKGVSVLGHNIIVKFTFRRRPENLQKSMKGYINYYAYVTAAGSWSLETSMTLVGINQYVYVSGSYGSNPLVLDRILYLRDGINLSHWKAVCLVLFVLSQLDSLAIWRHEKLS